MTARERVIASRLIQKIEKQGGYAEQIGLSCKLEAAGSHTGITGSVNKKIQPSIKEKFL